MTDMHVYLVARDKKSISCFLFSVRSLRNAGGKKQRKQRKKQQHDDWLNEKQ